MVAGHLQEKGDYYYIVLSYRDINNKRKTKWISTGLKLKGNKKKAEALLLETRKNFKPELIALKDDMLFADFLEQWLSVVKTRIEITTYASYENQVKKTIAPYFRERQITLKNLKATDIQTFYMVQLNRVKPNSVIHYHANIHAALKYAVKIDLIDFNPADKVERPKKNSFSPSFYSDEEIERLFEVSQGTLLEIPIFLGAFYGLRRSEVVGLKWSAIDFEKDTITINHIITTCSLGGKHVQVVKDTTKTKSSRRTLPLVKPFKERLVELYQKQEEYKELCGNSYNYEFEEYICVDPMGNLTQPNYISDAFPRLLEKNGLRHIRFHDLRHSCASLLLANGVPMKQIQEWLGHSDFSTTANIYAHLDYTSKLSSADALVNGLSDALSVYQ